MAGGQIVTPRANSARDEDSPQSALLLEQKNGVLMLFLDYRPKNVVCLDKVASALDDLGLQIRIQVLDLSHPVVCGLPEIGDAGKTAGNRDPREQNPLRKVRRIAFISA